MARDYGKIFTAAWGDPAYRALTGRAQHLYMQLVSQPDTTMAGVLTTAPARWAGQFVDGTVEAVQEALDELERARFIVTDTETMETLIRAFVRRDLGWRSPRTMIAVDSSIRAILSPMLRGVIAEELLRCDTSDLSDQISAKTGQSTKYVVEKLIRSLVQDCTILPPDQEKHGCDDRVSDRVRSSSLTATATATATAPANAHANGGARAPARDDDPTLLDPQPPSETPPRKRGNAYVYPDEFERFWKPYPNKDDKRKALPVWRRVVREVPNEVLIRAAEAYRDDPNRTEGFTKLATTWLNAGSWENGPIPPRGGSSGRPQAGDTHRAMARSHSAAQAYRALEQSGYYEPPKIAGRRTA